MYRTSLYLTIFSLTLCTQIFGGCDEVADSLEEALIADPQRSTCQAYCEWAVACHGEARELDADATLEKCLADTKAVNEQCEVMETDGINKLSSDFYKSCTDAIDAKRMSNECAPFTGDAVAINSSVAPSECAVVAGDDIDVFNTARLATAESNDELCDRMSVTLCKRSTSCLVDEFNVPQSYLDELMPSAEEQCITQFEESVTSACRNDDLYAISSEVSEPTEMKADVESEAADVIPNVFFSVNLSREAARACLLAISELACGDFFSAELPPECAAAFSDPVSTVSTINDFACGLEREELEPICGDE